MKKTKGPTAYTCLPEVMAACPVRATTNCEGHFYSLYTACGAANRKACAEQAAAEAVKFGINPDVSRGTARYLRRFLGEEANNAQAGDTPNASRP